MLDKLNELFNQLRQIVSLDEVGYHEIKNGKLNPIHKLETDVLSSEKWKRTHVEHPVYVKDNPLLIEVIHDKQVIAISNTHEDERSSKAFGLFGIDSIMVIPVMNQTLDVKGVIIIPSINHYHSFTEEEIKKCHKIVEGYRQFLV